MRGGGGWPIEFLKKIYEPAYDIVAPLGTSLRDTPVCTISFTVCVLKNH